MIKPQYVEHIPRAVNGTVSKIVSQKEERDNKDKMFQELDLQPILDREIKLLSGGELQRFAIAVMCVQNADMYVYLLLEVKTGRVLMRNLFSSFPPPKIYV